jgi:glycerol-3-phosphate cytidylyltransferase
MGKLKNKKEIGRVVRQLRRQGKKIVTCNGCFDIIHSGHIKFLTEAKRQGNILIVGLNSDSSVGQIKGKSRPIYGEKDRAIILEALGCVDFVVIFNETTPNNLLEIIRPDVHVNGKEYGENCVEAPTVKKYGGKIYLVERKGGDSTTRIMDKIKRLKE